MMTPERLREIYGDPAPLAAAKARDRLDAHDRSFIAHAPFLVLATSNGDTLDVSPKGDPAGFVLVESDTSLLLPDRPGNNRIDGLLNILAHPQVALLFLIPTVDETLRVNGVAEISDDPALLKRCALKGRDPRTVLRITVTEVFFHCGKAPMRAGLWRPENWPDTRPLPALYEILRDQTGLAVPTTSQEATEARYRDTLY